MNLKLVRNFNSVFALTILMNPSNIFANPYSLNQQTALDSRMLHETMNHPLENTRSANEAINAYDAIELVFPDSDKSNNPDELLVVLVNFSDEKIQSSEFEFYNQVFGDDKSVATYFDRNSYGKFKLVPASNLNHTQYPGIVSIEVSFPHPQPSKELTGSQQLSDEAMEIIINTLSQRIGKTPEQIVSSNFPKTMLVLAGQERAYNPNVTTAALSAFTGQFSYKRSAFNESNYYLAVISERHGAQTAPKGIIAHELGHLLLGLNDLYCQEEAKASECVKSQGLMGEGSWNALPGQQRGSSPADILGWHKAKKGFATIQDLHLDNQYIEVTKNDQQPDIKRIWLDPYRHQEALLLEQGIETATQAPKLLTSHLQAKTYDSANNEFWFNTVFNDVSTLVNDKNLINLIHQDQNVSGIQLSGVSEDKNSLGYNLDPFSPTSTGQSSRIFTKITMTLTNIQEQADFADGVDVYLRGTVALIDSLNQIRISLTDNQDTLLASTEIHFQGEGWYRVFFEEPVAIDAYSDVNLNISTRGQSIGYELSTAQHNNAHQYFESFWGNKKRVYHMRLLVSGNVKQSPKLEAEMPITLNSPSDQTVTQVAQRSGGGSGGSMNGYLIAVLMILMASSHLPAKLTRKV